MHVNFEVKSTIKTLGSAASKGKRYHKRVDSRSQMRINMRK